MQNIKSVSPMPKYVDFSDVDQSSFPKRLEPARKFKKKKKKILARQTRGYRFSGEGPRGGIVKQN